MKLLASASVVSFVASNQTEILKTGIHACTYGCTANRHNTVRAAAAASTWWPETSTASNVVSIRVLRHSALCSRINKQAVSAEQPSW